MNEIGYQSPYSNQNQYIYPSTGDKIKGVLIGTLAGGVVSSPRLPISKGFNNIIGKFSDITDVEHTNIETAAKEALVKTGLDKKGVKIVAKPDFYEFLNFFEDTSKNIQLLVPKFEKKGNVIRTSDYKCILPIFGEIGHALNHHSILGKTLSFLSALAVPFTSVVSTISILKTKKAPGELPESKSDKITTFIKENSGKLVLAASVPALLEEGVAMIKGNKLAKEFLSPELAKNAKKINAASFGLKALTALVGALSVVGAKHVKDSIVQKEIAYDLPYQDDFYQDEQYYYGEPNYYEQDYYDAPYYKN